ncbi:MAG: hypothetical protein ACI4JW_03500 [Oscillospiraceae bacterium]
MLFGERLHRARGREISNQEKRSYYKREAIQSEGSEICGALEVMTERVRPLVCDESFYYMLEKTYTDHRRKTRRNRSSILFAVLLCGFALIHTMKRFLDPIRTESTNGMLLLSIAVIFLIFTMFRRIRYAARLNRVGECIRQRANITAYPIRIDELVWHDNSDSESTEYVPYLRGENILFCVTNEVFNNACPGEYFTAVIVNTGREKMFFLL